MKLIHDLNNSTCIVRLSPSSQSLINHRNKVLILTQFSDSAQCCTLGVLFRSCLHNEGIWEYVCLKQLFRALSKLRENQSVFVITMFYQIVLFPCKHKGCLG